MSNTQDVTSSNQVYGFLCEKTNIFYAFETQEEYQEFIQWLQDEAEAKDGS